MRIGLLASSRRRDTGTPPPAGLPALPWDSHVGTPTSLAEEVSFVAALAAATSRVRQVTLGASAQGRTIRAVLVGPPRSRDQIRAATTMLIIGSHHGDEWAGREALFAFARDHAAGTGTETLIWIPTLNPDGFSIPQRNLANNSDPNRGWPPDGRDNRVSYGTNTGSTANMTSGNVGALYVEQQCLRQALLLWRPKIVFDTHEYTSAGVTYRFDPGTVNGALADGSFTTPAAVSSIDTAALTALRSAATAAGYTISTYTGPIPNDGATQALKLGGIPGIFTESPQESSGGLTLRRAQQLSSLAAFQTWVRANTTTLADQAAVATWYGANLPTVVDDYAATAPPVGVLFEGGFEQGVIPPYSSTDIAGGADNPANQYTTVEADGDSVAENNAPVLAFDTTWLRNARSTRSLHITGRGRLSTGTGTATKRAQFRLAFPTKTSPFFQPTADGNDNEYWWGFSFYLGEGYDLSFLSAANFHNIFGPRQTTGETFYMTLQNNLGAGTITMRRAPAEAPRTWPDSLGADQLHNPRLAELGKWIDIVGHAKFSTTTTNALREFWVRVEGDTAWTHSGQQTSANVNLAGDNTRFRLGLYTETNYDPDRHLWFDNVRLGTSFAAVDPTTVDTTPAPSNPYGYPAAYPAAYPGPPAPPAPGAITLVGSTVFEPTSATTTAVTITAPTGCQAGDLLIALAAGSTGTPPVVPAGWTALETRLDYGPSTTTIYRRWQVGDTSWSWAVASAKWCGLTVALRGVDPTTMRDATTPAAATTTATAFPTPAPAITTVTAGAWVLCLGGTIGPGADTNVDWTTDGTIAAEATAGAAATTNPACVLTYRIKASPGVVSPTLAPVETVTRGGVQTLALRPAPSA